MKKVRYLFLFVMAVLAGVICTNAAGGVSLNGAGSVTAGDTVELIVSVSNCSDVSSASVAFSYGSEFEFVSAAWLKTGALTHFDTSANKGVIGGLSSPDINGDLFRLVLRAKVPSADVHTVSVTVAAKNGAADVIKETAVKNISITCTAHSFGYWHTDEQEHHRVCTVCGTEVKAPHAWDHGVVTRPPTCAQGGVKLYTCVDCRHTKTVLLPAVVEHSYGPWIAVDSDNHKEVCLVCGQEIMHPHTWDAGAITSTPTCMHEGVEIYNCMQCGHTKTQPIPVVEHDYIEGICQWCSGEDPNYVPPVPGNLNEDDVVDNQDVELLLWYTLFPEEYTIPVSADFNHDGVTNNEDVEYLLWHTLFPDDYPIE